MAQPSDPVATAQELRVAVGRLARRMRRLYDADATSDDAATFTQVAILVRLQREGPSSPGDLAGRERVTSQAIAAVVRELERRGLVVRARDAGDRRRVTIAITDAGRALLRDREQAVMAALVRALGEDCTAAERRRLEAVAPLLNRLADVL